MSAKGRGKALLSSTEVEEMERRNPHLRSTYYVPDLLDVTSFTSQDCPVKLV